MEGFLEIALQDNGKDDNSIQVREETLLALHLLPEAEQRILFKLLEQSEDEDLRVRILKRLFELDKAKVTVSIKSTAMQAPPRVRIAAIRMLGKLKGDKEATDLLAKFLEEPDERVRIAAALTVLGG
jgi:HEAT repeat protein